MIRNSSILITGAGGEVGSQLIKLLSMRENINIVTLDLYPLDSKISNMVSNQIIGNVLDQKLLDQINLKMLNKKIQKLITLFFAFSFGIPFLIMPLAQGINQLLNEGKHNTTNNLSLIQIIVIS